MMDDKYLHNAIKLLKKRDFLEAINNLEEYIANDNSNYLAYYFLGLAYIFRELYDEAYKYISKAYKLNDNDINTINTLAFLNLKYNNVDEAINYWLDILDIDKKNYIAKRNLEKVKKSKNIQKLVNAAKPDEFVTFKIKKSLDLPFSMPSFSHIINPKYVIAGMILIAVFFIIIYIINIKPSSTKKERLSQKQLQTLNNMNLPNLENDYLIDNNISKSPFNLKPEEIKQLFYQTKKLIARQYFNQATININKVLHSNAHFIVKEKFQILKQFLGYHSSFKIKDNVNYNTLINLPLLYEEVQVIWQGKIEDIELSEEENSTTFNLFIKQEGQSIGMAKVYFNRLFNNLNNGNEVIISGRFIKIDKQNRNPIIEGIGVKDLP